MLRRLLETIKELILLFLLLGFGSALIDYARMNAGVKPLFSVKEFNSSKKIESYQGIFYTASRMITSSVDEDFINSSNIHYQLFTLEVPINRDFKKVQLDYQLIVHESDNCDAKLYYSDSNHKIYTTCMDSIDIKDNGSNITKDFSKYLEKDPFIIEDVIAKSDFIKNINDSILMYQSNDSLLLPKTIIYECPNKDIYLTLNGEFQEDFCTSKES